jgi:hypothetical protein
MIVTGTRSGETHPTNGDHNGNGDTITFDIDGPKGSGWDNSSFNQAPSAVYKVNECLFRRDICGLGKCVDTDAG